MAIITFCQIINTQLCLPHSKRWREAGAQPVAGCNRCDICYFVVFSTLGRSAICLTGDLGAPECRRPQIRLRQERPRRLFWILLIFIEIATCTKTSWIKTWQHSPFGPDPALMRRAAIHFIFGVLCKLLFIVVVSNL